MKKFIQTIIFLYTHTLLVSSAHEFLPSDYGAWLPKKGSSQESQSWMNWLGFSSEKPQSVPMPARNPEKKLENQQRAVVRKIERIKKPQISLPLIEEQRIHIASFAQDGFPTKEALLAIIKDQFFGKQDNVEIDINSVSTGSYSDKVYQITANTKDDAGYTNKINSVFFLKISSSADSDQRLINLQQNSVGRLGSQRYKDIDGNYIPVENLPSISWLEKIMTYQDSAGKINTIEITHAASGDSLYELIFKRLDNFAQYGQRLFPNEQTYRTVEYNNIKTAESAIKKMGTSLGSFQQAFMTYPDTTNATTWQTVAHKDLNLTNIFYEPKKQKIYFIDNESMQEHESILTDLNNFLAFTTRSILASEHTAKSFIKPENAQLIAYNYTIWFLQGYIESFPKNKQATIAQLLQNQTSTTTNHTTPLPIYYSQQVKNGIYDFLNSHYVHPSTQEPIANLKRTGSISMIDAKEIDLTETPTKKTKITA